MKKVINILIALSTIFLFSNCVKKNSCDGVTCQNGGICNNGDCKCPDGYEGEFCQTKKTNNIDIDFTINTLSGNYPLTVSTSANVKSGEVSAYTWNFGDGTSTLEGSSASHTYTSAGTFTITLTAEGKYNSTNTASKSITVSTPPTPPLAKFSFSPTSPIIADNTVVSFSNLSTGTINAFQWDFGTNEATSTIQSPTYRFNREGTKTVKLVATGPLGSHTTTQTLTVYAMNPGCNNYTDGSSQSESKINSIRNSGQLKTGKITFQNDYSGAVKVELYHSDEWLNGRYIAFNNSYWTVNTNTTTSFTLQGSSFAVGNDWGIKVIFSNGVESCIRNIQSIATYSASSGFTIKATSIFN